MEETLISFETAKLAKEKGFNELCRYFYTLPSRTLHDNTEDICALESGEIEDVFNSDNYKYSAPTQSLLQKWLREVHNIKVTVLPSYRPGYNNYFIEILCIKKFKQLDGYYDIYEEALEEGLQVALELIK